MGAWQSDVRQTVRMSPSGTGRPHGTIAESEVGLFSVYVEPDRMVRIANAFDPEGSPIILETHGFDARWRELRIPLTEPTWSDPPSVLVRNVGFDACLSLAEFKTFAQSWTSHIYAFQYRGDAPPKSSLSRGRRGPAEFVDVMREMGITLMVDSPGLKEVSMLASLDESLLRKALDRFHADRLECP